MAANRLSCGVIVGSIALCAIVLAATLVILNLPTPLYPDAASIPSAANSQFPPRWSATVDRLRRLIRARVAEHNLPGLSVAVGGGGEIIWAEGFGWSDIEGNLPVTPQTGFRIGTASQALTSAAVGLLVEKDQLKLDNQIQAYVPRYPKKPWPITLRHLMAHTGGIATDPGGDGLLSRQRCEAPVDAVAFFGHDALSFEPETQYRQSPYGWILVSAAVEAAVGEPFLRAMRTRVFAPLGMAQTGAESATAENPERVGEPEEDPPPFTFVRQVILKPLGVVSPAVKRETDPATLYSPGFGHDPVIRHGLHGTSPRNLSCYAGSMAFYSTPSDLVRFGLAMNGGRLLQTDTVRLLWTSSRLAAGEETGHGLGWDLDTISVGGRNVASAGVDGELAGRKVVSLVVLPESGVVVAVMTNLSYADLPALAREIALAFAEAAPEP